MSRPLKILRNAAIGLGAVLILLVAAAIVVVQTDWFRAYVKQKIITATEDGTGGKVDLGTFTFDWTHLRAIVTGFVIHGNEPPGDAPFVRAERVELDLRLFTSVTHLFELAYLGIDRPEANILVFADGRTNVPTPKVKSTADTTALETVVDLAVGHFELTNGVVRFNSKPQPLDVRGYNLRAQFFYNLLGREYKGQISLQPLYVVSGRNTPVNLTVTLPLTLHQDRIEFHNAKIVTPASELVINGALENLRNPKTKAHIQGHLALADLKNVAGLSLSLKTQHSLDLDADATVAASIIDVARLRLGLGNSTMEASGRLRDPDGKGALQFKAQLALAEIGRMANLAERPAGRLAMNGTASLDAAGNYLVNAKLSAEGVSFQQGKQRIGKVSLFSTVRLDPHRLDLNGLRLDAFGGELAGDASLEDFARYKLKANLRHLDLKMVARSLPYSGIVSGPVAAQGDLKAPGTKSITAQARLSIAPKKTGVPLTGRLNATYNGRTDNIALSDSYLALPHSRLNMNGSLNERLNIALTTTDLKDLPAAMPVTLNGGQASFTGAVTGSLNAPAIAGHLAATRFAVDGRQFDALAADVSASSSKAVVTNGSVTRSAMQAQFSAAVGLKNWDPTPNQPLAADASITKGDLADIMVLAGQPSARYSGSLSLQAHITGTVGNPGGTANLVAAGGTIQGEPFDRIEAQVNMADQLISIPSAYVTAGSARVNLTAEFRHPRDSLSTGAVHAQMQSNPFDLAQFPTLQKQWPNTSGQVRIQADAAGTLAPNSEFQITSLNADASARHLRFEAQDYGDFTASAKTSGQTVSYNVVSDFAGSNLHVNGNTQLAQGYPTRADLTLSKLPIERVLALAKRQDIPARGMLSGTAHVSGTLDSPQGDAEVELAKAVLYDEPVDRVHAKVSYQLRTIDAPQLEIVAGPSHLELTARYDHPAGNLQQGALQFRVTDGRIDLAKIQNIQKARPGLAGAVQISASGSAVVGDAVLFRDLNANLSAPNISVNGKSFGGLTLAATTAGSKLNFTLDSNLARAAIKGHGSAELSGAYPVDAQVSFTNATWAGIHELLQPGAADFEAAADGQVTISGSATKSAELRGAVELSRLQVNSLAGRGKARKVVTIKNQGPIAFTVDQGVAQIKTLRLTGPGTDIQATGTASLKGQTLNLSVNATSDIGLLQSFVPDIYSSGSVTMATTVRGTAAKPLVNGRLELHDAALSYLEFPNGISKANGVVVFNGSSAAFRNITAESGGGTLTLGGYATMTDRLRFGLRAGAANVRMRLQQGVSVVAGANLNVTGTTDASAVTGTVTIDQLTYAPQSDFGSILAQATPTVEAPASPSALLDNMKLDVRVRTSASMAVRASLAQNLQTEADLRVRGTASQPSVLGRVTITEGELLFFGSTYTVNSGTVSFYNPLRIEPVLNVNLETQSQGVDVQLTVTGPVDNMKLSYTSDPPLQFDQIVALLASGKTPTTDPTLLANQPSPPQQSFAQMGASALVGQALADPVSNRLQRVFGVSQFKVDPTFVSGSELPQARLTMQQKVTNNLTFTYVTALNDPNTQIIRAEWAFNPRFSAIAVRDQNGVFSLNFFYKKQYR